MFLDNNKQLSVHLDYKLVKIELAFMITKASFIRSFKCDLSLVSVQHNIMHYIIAFTNNSLSQSNFKRTN